MKTFKLEKDEVVYDETFVVRKTRFGLHVSTVVETGESVITSLEKDACITATRFYLKGRQEGWPEGSTLSTHSGFVGGKL